MCIMCSETSRNPHVCWASVMGITYSQWRHHSPQHSRAFPLSCRCIWFTLVQGKKLSEKRAGGYHPAPVSEEAKKDCRCWRFVWVWKTVSVRRTHVSLSLSPSISLLSLSLSSIPPPLFLSLLYDPHSCVGPLHSHTSTITKKGARVSLKCKGSCEWVGRLCGPRTRFYRRRRHRRPFCCHSSFHLALSSSSSSSSSARRYHCL